MKLEIHLLVSGPAKVAAINNDVYQSEYFVPSSAVP
jgi:hypothetical protein